MSDGPRLADIALEGFITGISKVLPWIDFGDVSMIAIFSMQMYRSDPEFWDAVLRKSELSDTLANSQAQIDQTAADIRKLILEEN